jgi:sigma-E factor negative regulatory protein RseC
MIVEKAQVVAIENEYAIVQTQRRSACGACAVHEGCGVSILSKLLPGRFCTLKVGNQMGAKIGDKVQIGVGEGGLVKGALILYAVPLLLVVLSIVLATSIMGTDIPDLVAVLIVLPGFFVGLLFARLLSKRLVDNSECQTTIVAIDTVVDDESAIVFHQKLSS